MRKGYTLKVQFNRILDRFFLIEKSCLIYSIRWVRFYLEKLKIELLQSKFNLINNERNNLVFRGNTSYLFFVRDIKIGLVLIVGEITMAIITEGYNDNLVARVIIYALEVLETILIATYKK